MVFDKIENAHLYDALSPDIAFGLQYLAMTNLAEQANGRIPLNERITLSLSEYETFIDRSWEAHDRCVDIQFVVRGEEIIEYANREQLEYVSTAADKDQVVFKGTGNRILMKAGYFAILFPDDVHKPKVAVDVPKNVKKAVLKIKI